MLTGAGFVVRGLGNNAHVGERKADFSTDVLPFICRGNVEITGMVKGLSCGVPVVVCLEKIEFAVVSERAGNAIVSGVFDGILENAAAVRFKGRAVRISHITEHADNTAVGRSPGKYGERGRIRMEKQIGFLIFAEAVDIGAVKGKTFGKGAPKFAWHDGNVFLGAINVDEGKPYETDIFLLNIRQDVLGAVHGADLL